MCSIKQCQKNRQFLSETHKIDSHLIVNQSEELQQNKITISNYNNFVLYDKSNNRISTWSLPSKDLYLKPITDWTNCTKACNGGLHRREIKCVDENSRMKCPLFQRYFQEQNCNNDPCSIKEKLRIEVKRVFPKPQKFIKCVIKEGDIYFVREDVIISTQINPLVPVRVVLNNYFFSVYLTLTEKLFEIKLDDIKAVRKSNSNPTCFRIFDLKNRFKFCQLGSEEHASASEWMYDIMQFKTECNVYSKSSQSNPFKINFNQYNKLYDYYDWPDRETLMNYILDDSLHQDLSKNQEILCNKMKAFIEKSDKILAKLKQYEKRKPLQSGYNIIQLKEEIRQLLLKEKAEGDKISKAVEKLHKQKNLTGKSSKLMKKFENTIGEIKAKVNFQ